MSATPSRPSVVWLRDDLRVADNPALHAAVERGAPLLVLFVLDDSPEVSRPRGAASRWWLHHSLTSLAADLSSLGGRLLLRRGDAAEEVADVVRALDAGAVFWNRRYGGGEREQDTAIKSALRSQSIEVTSFDGSLLHEPWTLTKSDGSPYAVFSAFWRAALAAPAPRDPLPSPVSIDGWSGEIRGDDLDRWGLLPTAPDWAAGLRETWTPGEKTAQSSLDRFAEDDLQRYDDGRDVPALDATSRLSPHLRFGEISPHQIWHRLNGLGGSGVERYRSELGWREFNYSLLFHHPHIADSNLRPEFDAFPWRAPDPEDIRRWRTGRTGFPLVDAGMRQLWHIGWMHNRLRMVTASFLIKNLLLDWRVGEQWFWDTLVDADPANNTANWQWVAGSGVDAAPFFRVFNPTTQAAKFDPGGDYIRRWVPELRDLEAPAVHDPSDVLGVDGYPAPMVDLRETRARALEAFESVRRR